MKRVWLAWSSGKDAAWALKVLREAGEYEVKGLLCTFNEEFDRVAMHAVRRELVERQAEAAGLPLNTVFIPNPCPNEAYEEKMAEACRKAVAEGVEAIAFGDLFLEDVREYRERQMSGTGLQPLFPLWRMPTEELARQMVRGGHRAVITCVDPKQAPASLCGRDFDEEFLDGLPQGVDPCGERGEFHTFVWDSPVFAHPVMVERRPAIERDGFVFADVLPL